MKYLIILAFFALGACSSTGPKSCEGDACKIKKETCKDKEACKAKKKS